MHVFASNYLCPTCKLPVGNETPNDDPLGCDGPCKQWFHRQCINLSRRQYATVIENDSEWKCNTCLRDDRALEDRIMREVTPPPQIPEEITQADAFPAFTSARKPETRLTWGCLKGFNDINRCLTDAYNEVIKWSKNIFKLPYGRIGKSVVEEMCALISHYNEDADWEGLALKAAIVFLPLVLQKPSKKSKTKDHKLHLERRVDLWKKGLIKNLVEEGTAIQKRMFKSKRSAKQDLARSFCNLIIQGKIRAACNLLN